MDKQVEAEEKPSFQELWSAHGSELYRKCLRWMSGRVEEAEEAFSRAGMLAFQKYPAHQQELTDPYYWFLRLTYNVCMDLHRELKRERAWQVLSPETVEMASGPAQSAEFANPERLALRAELEQHVRRSVRSLSPMLREVAEPIFFEGTSYQEIADRLGVSVVALRKRVQQARAALRYQLAAYGAGSAGPQAPPPRLEVGGCMAAHPWSVATPVRLETPQTRLESGLEKDMVVPLGEPPQRPTARRLEGLYRYVERYPTGWKKRLQLARLLSLLGRGAEALTHYRAVIGRQPRRVSVWLEMAEIQRGLGCEAEALATWRSALRNARLEASEQHLRGRIAGCATDFSAAVAALAAAARLEPANGAHPIALGKICLEAGRAAEAAEAFGAALVIEPENAVALTLSHDALQSTGRPFEARRRVERAVALDSTGVVALEYLVGCRTRSRQVTGEAGRETRELLRRLEILAPSRAATQRCLADFHLARGEWDRAEHRFAAFLGKHSSYATAWRFFGRVLEGLGKSRLARTALRSALALDASDKHSRIALCRLLRDQGPEAELRSLIDSSLSRSPFDVDVVLMAADGLSQLPKEQTRVRDLLERASRLQPQCAGTALRLGSLLAGIGEVLQAIEVLEACWAQLPPDEASPQAAAAALTLGACWRRRGETERSRGWFRRALAQGEALLSLDPAMAQVFRGKALLALGDRATTDAFRAALGYRLLQPVRARVEGWLQCREAAGRDAVMGLHRSPLFWERSG